MSAQDGTPRGIDRLNDELYERFGKPLEVERAVALGRRVFVYKAGDRAVGRLR